MASNSADPLSKRHEQELAQLKRGGFSIRWTITVVLVLGVGAILAFRILTRYQGDAASLADARHDLISAAPDWGHDFTESQEWYHGWLSRHGTSVELGIFDRVSEILTHSAASFASRFASHENPSLLSRVYLALHAGLLRIVFLVLACLRLWIIAIGLSIIYGLRSIKVHSARDALGQTGNGRAFFSGVRVALDDATPEGAPSDQVTGLACPGSVPLAAAKASPLAKTLERFGAVTTTNLRLVGIIEHHKRHPAYVALPDHEGELAQFFEGSDLAENVERILSGALLLHQSYREEGVDLSEIEHVDHDEVLRRIRGGGQMTREEHAALTIESLDHVLTPKLKEALALLDAASIATVVLALEAGKSMAYSFEGGKWIRKSNFPQLCARSVLHSVPEFAQEYDFDLRMTIRRALIFGSRSSIFAPVKFPLDFRDESRAARQWVEILLTTPPQLTNCTNEVQLVGLMSELHQLWERVFFDGATALDPAVIDQVFATPQNLIFMPMTKVVQLMRRVIDRPTLQQLEVLVGLVSQEQRRRDAAQGNSDVQEILPEVPSYERIFSPFTQPQIKELIEVHGLAAEDIRDWSSLRVVLHSYGWLGRRVGERSVPESSVVCAAFSVPPDFPGANEFGFLGHVGMVPLRATRLEDRWGKVWSSRFIQVGITRMAENRRDFDRLLVGGEEDSEMEAAVSNAAVQGSGL